MLKRFLAPFLVLSLVFTVITIIGLNSEVLANTSEANQDYFIKPISSADLVVVEPNYGRFYNPNPQIKGDASGQVLYSSLDDLAEMYEIKDTKMVRFERKGQMIPNLYVYVNPISSQETLAYGLANE
jgi:hypothetical protein